MTTSGTYTFNLNTSEMIALAFQEINVYSLNKTIDSDDYLYALKKLNMMVKSWETDGLKLWTRKQATLFPVLNQASYQLGNVSGSDHCTNSYTATTTSASAISTATAIVVTSSTGFTATNPIGIELSDGTRQWTTISSVVSTTINLNAALTGAVASGNTVVTYTSKINRPLRCIRGTTLDLDNSSTETKMQFIGFDEYFDFPNKSSPGRPTNAYYDRLINNGVSYTGTLYLYNVPDNVNILPTFTYHNSLQDMINSTDSLDFPQEWFYPIVKNLAADLALPYGKITELQILQPQADKLKMTLENFDSDDTSLSMLPDFRR